MSWKAGAVWAVPFALWLVVVGTSVAALPWQIHEWRTNVSNWAPAIAESRDRGDEEMARRQEAWLARDERNGVLTVSAIAAVLVAALLAARTYRRKVPHETRGGWRAWLLAFPVLALLAAAGYAALAVLLRGAIKG